MSRTRPSSSARSLPSPKERRRLREAKALSEEQLAEAMGVTRATVRSWETGRSTPKGRKLELYARLLRDAPAEPAERTEGSERPPDPDRQPNRKPEPDRRPNRRPDQQPDRTKPATEPSVPAAEKPPAADEAAEAGPASASPTVSPAPVKHPPPSHPPAPDPVAAAPLPEAPRLTPEEAFDTLYEHVAPGLAHQAFLLTGRRRLSREAVEHAFHLAWQRWPEVAVDRDPAGWVRAVAHEYAMSPWHSFRRSLRHPDAPPTDPDRRELLAALLDLPPSYRRTLLLYDGLGLDLPDTAAETEASTPAAANRLIHAREAVAERLPELGDAKALQRRLTALVTETPTATIAPPRKVRTISERRTRMWTRAAIVLTTVIIGATAFTVTTAPTRYVPPLSPGATVGGIPVRSGPAQLTREDLQLREKLRSEPMNGPERLIPAVQ
ncbi:helix-turn-helix domain-containing protein [Streptomyces purpureus]|uniref:HTH cro/C1-type domain-containing protein n=1 Tax=Streptomyces purpureus TaxID=1951 RepID=A0A918LW79_9ACTN|nr:helix-turn-helix domain-containing protein [Streptomyces purpureus]GGT58821.1 hypothetical protein GCM10014713_60470 [Streptomyces purpureus]